MGRESNMFNSKLFFRKLFVGIIYGLLSGSFAWIIANIVEFITDYRIWQNISFTQATSDFPLPLYGFIFVLILASIFLEFVFTVRIIGNKYFRLIYGAIQFLSLYLCFLYIFFSTLMDGCKDSINARINCLKEYTVTFDLTLWLPILIALLIFSVIFPKIIEQFQQNYLKT